MSQNLNKGSRVARGLAVPVLTVVMILGARAVAMASWAASGNGHGAGAATVMPTGSTPGGTATGSSVTISWSSVTLPGGAAVAGYVINRYSTSNGAPATVGAGCSGVVTTTTCTELGVAAGSWVYTETPVQLNWTGPASPDSAPIVAS